MQPRVDAGLSLALTPALPAPGAWHVSDDPGGPSYHLKLVSSVGERQAQVHAGPCPAAPSRWSEKGCTMGLTQPGREVRPEPLRPGEHDGTVM